MTTIPERFNLDTPSGRFRARQAGHDVPKKQRGTVGLPFEAYVEKTDSCWIWTGAKDFKGYGVFKRNGRDWRASRWIWTEQNGPIPRGLFVLHTCDNPSCVNPDHLWLGTHDDNMRDRTEKNRQAKGVQTRVAILTDDAVRDIRARYRPQSYVGAIDGNAVELAAQYGVSVDVIWRVIRRELWKHVR